MTDGLNEEKEPVSKHGRDGEIRRQGRIGRTKEGGKEGRKSISYQQISWLLALHHHFSSTSFTLEILSSVVNHSHTISL